MKKIHIYLPLFDLIVVLFVSFIIIKALTLSSIVASLGFTSVIRLIFLLIIKKFYWKNKFQINPNYKFFFYFYAFITAISLFIGYSLIRWAEDPFMLL